MLCAGGFFRPSSSFLHRSYYGGGFFYSNPSVHKGTNASQLAAKQANANPSVHKRASTGFTTMAAAATASALANEPTPSTGPEGNQVGQLAGSFQCQWSLGVFQRKGCISAEVFFSLQPPELLRLTEMASS